MPIKLPSFRPRRDAYPPDLWTKCPSCSEMLFNKQLDKADRVCPTCGHHFRLSAAARLDQLLDRGSLPRARRRPPVASTRSASSTRSRTRTASRPPRSATGPPRRGRPGHRDDRRPAGLDLRHGLRVHGRLDGRRRRREGDPRRRGRPRRADPADHRVGVRAGRGCRRAPWPSCSWSRRAPPSSACGPPACRTSRVMSDPTTGGVFASFAVLGDVNLAEPNALIGFAGARVSAGTIAEELPPGFQRAEFLFDHGFVDRVVHRRELRDEVALLLRYLAPAEVGTDGSTVESPPDVRSDRVPLVARREGRPGHGRLAGGAGGAPIARGRRIARAGPRPSPSPCPPGPRGRPPMVDRLLGRNREAPPDAPLDAEGATSGAASSWPATCAGRGRSSSSARWPTSFVELHGDRAASATTRRSSPASPGSTAGGSSFVGQQKGADTDENIRRNFGMPHPEGYRKAMRVMELAERFGLPVVTFVDVPGAYPGAGVRGARHRRGDRPLDRSDEPAADADRHRHHRRGRLGRGARDRRRRRRHRPRERGLLGDQPRGLRLDPVADRGRGARPRPWR